jgi:hypothetical protein
VEGSIGSESRVVLAVTVNSLEAWRVSVGGSAAQPWGLFGSGTSARRISKGAYRGFRSVLGVTRPEEPGGH